MILTTMCLKLAHIGLSISALRGQATFIYLEFISHFIVSRKSC